ncbi:hypothetical protein Tco_0868349, partial [Tanacetum coccineum]
SVLVLGFRVSLFDLEAYLDSDYAGANLDRKSIIGDCQFLSRRLISWQCKKQTIVATSTTEAEYVAAANCCGDAYEKKLIQVLKIHNDDNVAGLLTKDFDTSAESRTVKNISYIDAIVASKPVTISKAPIRSDLLFDDAHVIDTLNNYAIFDTIQLTRVTAQAVEIKDLKAQIKQLKKKARLVINHHKAWFRVASTVKPDEGTDKQNGGTDRTKVSTDSFVEGTTKIKDQVSGESDTPTAPIMTSTPTLTVFGNDETIA